MEQVITMFHCSVNLTFTSTRAMGGASSTFAGVCPLLLCMGRNGVIISGAGQDIALVRTKPDVQQLPCPQQRVEFQCQIMVPSTGLTWTLPDGATLEFDGASAVGVVINSSDNAYSAALTGKTEDGNIDSFFFNSTLLVLEPVNGSNLTCGADAVENATTTVVISGQWPITTWVSQ